MSVAQGAPAPHELEVSLFGPGYGECVVVHLGYGDWLIIDSCRVPSRRAPAALQYLESLDVPADGVKAILSSHWHDDHINGMADLVTAYPNAIFACSSTLCGKEWLAFLEENDEFMSHHSSGVDEFREILRNHDAPHWSGWRTSIWDRLAPVAAQVWALSPSPEEVKRGKTEISVALAALPMDRNRILDTGGPNDASVVVWVRVGDWSLLLGADLEEHNDAARGWQAIIEGERPADIHNEKATVFKVAHHGSDNAHLDDVWTELLGEEPIALLAPWNRGQEGLPKATDVARITALTPNAWTTALAPRRKRKKRDPAVERMLRARGADNRPRIPDEYGHVQVRLPIAGGAPTVLVGGDAGHL